ncbi:ATP synthase subunit s, mitochondrial-like [Patiria miniata]|uniref:ATP synthase subunit s, mitochondrial n=1 Tax=Patiria miniata TaxID=46514 RepID=A0A914BHJ9_PATMI|nr:ATP synthase subunit s, mitochondrial-like [Patiria miniata]
MAAFLKRLFTEGKRTTHTGHWSYPTVRHLWGMLNAVFNKVDYARIKEIGPDQAAAEWLVRCGAAVKFKKVKDWDTDYNLLPRGPSGRFFIEEVDATDSCIMNIGFDYFIGLDHLRSLKLHHCTYLRDTCVSRLDILKDSLEEIQLSSCGDISDAGLVSLHKLHKLKHLFLCDLPAVKDIDSVLKTLGTALPSCEIRYLSLEGRKDLKKLGIDKEFFS